MNCQRPSTRIPFGRCLALCAALCFLVGCATAPVPFATKQRWVVIPPHTARYGIDNQTNNRVGYLLSPDGRVEAYQREGGELHYIKGQP